MSDLGWIEIPRWDDFQHYKRRDAPWIKAYLRLLDDDDYLSLTTEQRGVLHGLWLAYARSNGELVADTKRLSRRLSGRVTKATLDALVQAGFISIVAIKPLAARYHDASNGASTMLATRAPARSREAEAEAEAEREPLPNGQSGSSPRSAETAPPRAAKRAASAQGTNLTQNGSVATDVLAAYEAAAHWLRAGGANQTDWRYRVEVDFGVTDDIELAGLADLQQQLAGQEQHA